MKPGENTTQTCSNLWIAAATPPDRSEKRSRLKKSDLITFQEFEEISRCTDDQFWIDVLMKCAKKKFPRGFIYADKVLRYRPDEVQIYLPDDLEARYHTVVCFFQENGKMYSSRDQETKRRVEEEREMAELSLASNTWKHITSSKNRRATHVRNYVEREFPDVPKNIRGKLYTQIEVGFDTKFITKDNVVVEDGQIMSIDGVTIQDGEIVFTRPLPKITLPTLHPPTGRQEHHNHFNSWTKYLKGYAKHIQQSSKPNSSAFLSTDSGMMTE